MPLKRPLGSHNALKHGCCALSFKSIELTSLENSRLIRAQRMN